MKSKQGTFTAALTEMLAHYRAAAERQAGSTVEHVGDMQGTAAVSLGSSSRRSQSTRNCRPRGKTLRP